MGEVGIEPPPGGNRVTIGESGRGPATWRPAIRSTDPRGNTVFHDGNSFQVDLTRYISERSDFASSGSVLDRARELAPSAGSTTQDVRDACQVSPEDTGKVLVIECSYANEKTARSVVDAIATAYRELTTAQTADKAGAAIDALDGASSSFVPLSLNHRVVAT